MLMLASGTEPTLWYALRREVNLQLRGEHLHSMLLRASWTEPMLCYTAVLYGHLETTIIVIVIAIIVIVIADRNSNSNSTIVIVKASQRGSGKGLLRFLLLL